MNSKKGLIIGSIVFVVIVACFVIADVVFGLGFFAYFDSEIGSGSLDIIYK